MKIGNLNGRAVVAVDGGVLDIGMASGGRLPAELNDLFSHWDDVRKLVTDHHTDDVQSIALDQLGTPCPAPRQVFGIGLNYRDHAAEANFAVPQNPTVFTKYVSSFTNANGAVELPSENVDWEVEVVAVIGQTAQRIPEDDGWNYVAGLSVGQDLSERVVQMDGPVPQFGLGKSFPGFSPIGPWIVTTDELPNPDDLELGCAINGVEVQKGRTKEMIFSIPALVSRLSHIVTLYPGDVIFTGTPAGIGNAREPKWFLKPDDVLTSYVVGLGEMRHVLQAKSTAGV